MNRLKTTKYGDEVVSVLQRDWISAARMPYRKTYRLTAHQHWYEAPTTSDQWEHYALLPSGHAVPVGVPIARELIPDGA